MIARFDHRPMLTALLALSTTVLLIVVITLSALLINSAPPAASPASTSSGSNPAAPKVMDAESYGEVYGYDIYRASRTGNSVERHHKPVSD